MHHIRCKNKIMHNSNVDVIMPHIDYSMKIKQDMCRIVYMTNY